MPHAESAEEEFVYVIEGTPDAWIDGELFRLAPGDGVAFPAGTGIAHSFLNNTDAAVRLIVVGEVAKPENRIVYPVNPERRPHRPDWWEDAPVRPLGPHDGRPRRPGMTRLGPRLLSALEVRAVPAAEIGGGLVGGVEEVVDRGGGIGERAHIVVGEQELPERRTVRAPARGSTLAAAKPGGSG